MNRHSRRRLGSLFGFFAIGLVTDILIVFYLKSVSFGVVPLAMLFSFLVTMIPFIVTERGIRVNSYEIFFSYALGAAGGTAIGMLVKI